MRPEGYGDFGFHVDYPYTMPYSINRPSGNFGPHPGRPSGGDEHTHRISDNFSLFLGSHNLKFGGHYVYSHNASDVYALIPGLYIFTTDIPFDAADTSTYPRRFRYITGPPYSVNPIKDLGLFVQDSWKVLPRLTLNFGVRYNYYDISVLDIASTKSGNFNARFGFSWDPVGDGKTSIRGGIGTFTANPPMRAAGNTNRNNLVTTVTINWPGYPDPFQPNPFRPQTPGQTSNDEYTSKPGLNPAHSFQTTLGFQREVATDLSVSADLVYSKTYNLWRRIDQNPIIPGTSFVRIDPTRGEVRTIDDGSRAEYKALMLTFNKRYAKGWAFELSYTLSDSKSMTEAGEFDLPHSYEPDGWEKQYGPTDRDARHRLAMNAIFDLPLGFQLSGIFYYRSATPYTAYEGTDVNLDGLLDDYVGDENRNSRRGFDQSYLNARLSKYVNIDRLRLQLFAEMFNVFNKNNFTNIEDDIRSAIFGMPLSAGDPRLIQFGVRLDF
jgi:outer membrane receptor protein involved in Fe transport